MEPWSKAVIWGCGLWDAVGAAVRVRVHCNAAGLSNTQCLIFSRLDMNWWGVCSSWGHPRRSNCNAEGPDGGLRAA